MTYLEYQAQFTQRGTSIREWAISSGLSPASVYDALKGARSGPSAKAIVRRAKAYLSRTSIAA